MYKISIYRYNIDISTSLKWGKTKEFPPYTQYGWNILRHAETEKHSSVWGAVCWGCCAVPRLASASNVFRFYTVANSFNYRNGGMKIENKIYPNYAVWLEVITKSKVGSLTMQPTKHDITGMPLYRMYPYPIHWNTVKNWNERFLTAQSKWKQSNTLEWDKRSFLEFPNNV